MCTPDNYLNKLAPMTQEFRFQWQEGGGREGERGGAMPNFVQSLGRGGQWINPLQAFNNLPHISLSPHLCSSPLKCTITNIIIIIITLKKSPKDQLPSISKKVWWYVSLPTSSRSLCLPPARIHFWELTTRVSLAKSLLGSTVPWKIGLNYEGECVCECEKNV